MVAGGWLPHAGRQRVMRRRSIRPQAISDFAGGLSVMEGQTDGAHGDTQGGKKKPISTSPQKRFMVPRGFVIGKVG